jgi:hypothetical protein
MLKTCFGNRLVTQFDQSLDCAVFLGGITYTRSTIVAIPMPPPTHSVAMP